MKKKKEKPKGMGEKGRNSPKIKIEDKTQKPGEEKISENEQITFWRMSTEKERQRERE